MTASVNAFAATPFSPNFLKNDFTEYGMDVDGKSGDFYGDTMNVSFTEIGNSLVEVEALGKPVIDAIVYFSHRKP